MLGDSFWLCVEALAESIDGSEAASEEALNQMEGSLRQLNRVDRDEMRRHMILIVGELARVEVRMMETDGLTRAAFGSLSTVRAMAASLARRGPA